MTRGHSYDQLVLGQALRTDAGYVGMIGSRRKISTIYENLLKEGFSNEDFNRVHSPVGLEIGAETPAEIALSIVAELVKVRAGLKKGAGNES
jgi:xanthine dehydrogenase accessory factor